MKRILGLIVAAGLGLAWAAPAHAQMVVVGGAPYAPGVSVNVPGFYGNFGSVYGYPGPTFYGSGYSGFVGPGIGHPVGGYFPAARVYSFGSPVYGGFYGPYRRGWWGGRWRRGYWW